MVDPTISTILNADRHEANRLGSDAWLGCVFRTCPGEFYGKLVCTVTSTNDTTLLLILSFFHSSLVVVQRSSTGRSRRVTRQPESIAFFLGGGGGFSADWQRIRTHGYRSVSLETVRASFFCSSIVGKIRYGQFARVYVHITLLAAVAIATSGC